MLNVQLFTIKLVSTGTAHHDHSIIACSRHIYMGVILCAHPIRGESHKQRNADGEVATNETRTTTVIFSLGLSATTNKAT